ncbi:Spx/MgsR family RNA polymerase-binding regulatory protein [Rossellomorea vietnamensis]|uniref:Spx/MgsR family RNA polymerase-binding regulatory protein n=2 Tax=Rossellomorea TaxID=2837508 RepID=A0A5D4KDV7_9BACI|nr:MULTISPECIES: Spx/MgsR family RNA polymerase-binding regulatory protein [Rossellomorea]TYR75537.1 Spx/MgsR family RNA polymerase-binding regulatory protein [Rossellomorea vietnamensis]TYS76581.1 Spx/MgsR family RNA polymerase-binding regulatory protein [Rossellomorea aquimaris]
MNKLTFFTYPSCTSCRKAKKWLTSNAVDFEERHIFRETPTTQEIIDLLSMTTNGVDEILATRSQKYKALGVELEDLSLSEVVQLISEEPKLLRRPLLTDGKKLVVGYDPEGLRSLTNKRSVYELTV